MRTPLDLTIAIPTKNEAQNLAGCLLSIGNELAKKIIIIDSASTDDTKAIAKRFDVEVIDFKWNGKFPKKRNWYLRNYTTKTKWILFLDADEYLTEEFKEELCKALSQDDKTGYWLNYTVYFLGKKLKGGYPLRKLALFQVGAGEYEYIDEENWSDLDMEVHEHPLLKGSIGTFKSKIDHQDFGGISRFILKHKEYASWEASRFLCESEKSKKLSPWHKKQNVKYYLMSYALFAPAFFLASFFLYGGFRDGTRGFAHAILRMAYYTQVYCKIREMRAARKRSDMVFNNELNHLKPHSYESKKYTHYN